jgi:mono/diheme cytochrome c family protein
MMRTVLVCVVTLAASSAYAQDAALVKRGEAVYNAQKCVVCHSIAGKGNQRGALDKVGGKLSSDDLHQWITAAPAMAAKTQATRKPVMKAYSDLPKEDVDALVAYLQGLK